jgi:hypothetical protein
VEPTEGMPTALEATTKQTVPVAFCSRKLAPGQVRTWSPREKETCAVVLALQKWASYIGLQPVLILTDHKALEAWATETLDTPSGPAGRRARWHELFSKFDIHVTYIPGKDNVAADALSRWAYPASKAFADVSLHGSQADEEAMEGYIRDERAEERMCASNTLAPSFEAAMDLLWEETFCLAMPIAGASEMEFGDAYASISVTTRSGRHSGDMVDIGVHEEWSEAHSSLPHLPEHASQRTRMPESGQEESFDTEVAPAKDEAKGRDATSSARPRQSPRTTLGRRRMRDSLPPQQAIEEPESLPSLSQSPTDVKEGEPRSTCFIPEPMSPSRELSSPKPRRSNRLS